jgi:hypothetical protein
MSISLKLDVPWLTSNNLTPCSADRRNGNSKENNAQESLSWILTTNYSGTTNPVTTSYGPLTLTATAAGYQPLTLSVDLTQNKIIKGTMVH